MPSNISRNRLCPSRLQYRCGDGEWVSSSFRVSQCSALTFSNLWVAQRSPAHCHELVIYVRLNVYVRGLHSHSGLYPLLPAKLCQSVTIRLMEWSLSEQDELWPVKPKQDSRQGEAHNRHLAYPMYGIPTNTHSFLIEYWIEGRSRVSFPAAGGKNKSQVWPTTEGTKRWLCSR